eukprot:GFYU01004513.1.p1 GENE.GFYU01004513.1~~GFYU01004513.1.p1  ORF type:complete len:288 (-),score=34.77 GFYU01004513.1:111-974(-)
MAGGLHGWMTSTPLFTRFVMISHVVSFLTLFLLGWDNATVNPLVLRVYPTLFQFQFWRIFTSPYTSSNILGLVFGMLFFYRIGVDIETKMGTIAFIYTFVVISAIINVCFCLFAWIMFDKMMLLFAFSEGLYPILMFLLVLYCLNHPEADRSFWGLITVKALYYPLIIAGFFSLLSGFRVDIWLGVGLGYSYCYGHLDKLKITQNGIAKYEPRLVDRMGFIKGSGAWSDSGELQVAADPESGRGAGNVRGFGATNTQAAPAPSGGGGGHSAFSGSGQRLGGGGGGGG